MTTMKLREVDERVTYTQHLQEDSGPVVLINQFSVAPVTPKQNRSICPRVAQRGCSLA
jgi:hypothetical protein